MNALNEEDALEQAKCICKEANALEAKLLKKFTLTTPEGTVIKVFDYIYNEYLAVTVCEPTLEDALSHYEFDQFRKQIDSGEYIIKEDNCSLFEKLYISENETNDEDYETLKVKAYTLDLIKALFQLQVNVKNDSVSVSIEGDGDEYPEFVNEYISTKDEKLKEAVKKINEFLTKEEH